MNPYFNNYFVSLPLTMELYKGYSKKIVTNKWKNNLRLLYAPYNVNYVQHPD